MGNIAKTMMSNGKQFTVTHEMLMVVAPDQKGGLMLSLESQHGGFSKLAFVLIYNKSLNDWSLGEK